MRTETHRLTARWLATVSMLVVALALSACDNGETAATSDPSATPAASTSATAPEEARPPEPGPSEPETARRLAETYSALSGPEQECIQDQLGEENLEIFLRTPEGGLYDHPEHWQPAAIFGCLKRETANELYMAHIRAIPGIDQVSLSCLERVIPDVDIPEVIAADVSGAAAETKAAGDEFLDRFEACLYELDPPDVTGPPLRRSDRLWRFATGQTSTVALSPTVVQGRLFAVSGAGEVYAVNARTGELLWSIDMDTGSDSDAWARPVAAGSTVYIEHPRGEFYSVDAATGERLLVNIEEAGRIRGVQLRDGAVHVTAVLPDGAIAVRSHDPQTGHLLRESRAQVPGIDYDQFKVTVLGESTYIRDGAKIHALDGPEGNLRWSFMAGETIFDAPAASDGRVYLRTFGGIHALDEATGDEIWSFEGTYSFANDITPGIANPLLVEEGVLAVPEVRGALHGLDAATGQALWSSRHGYAYSVAAAADGTLFVGGSDGFHALDAATGEEIWSISRSWNILGEVTVADGVLYASGLGYLHALNARTGEPIWSTDHCCVYVLQDGVLYMADQGTILAYSAPATMDTSRPAATPAPAPTASPTPTPTPTPAPTASPTPTPTTEPEPEIHTIQGRVVGPNNQPVERILLIALDRSTDSSGVAEVGEDGSFAMEVPDGSFVLNVLVQTPERDSYSLVGWYGPGGFTTKERDATRIEVDGESVSGIVILLPDQLDALHCSVIVDSCQVQDDDLLWLFDTGQTNALTFSPTIVQGRLYAASSVGEVYALNARTGELLWSIDLDAELQPPPVAAGSTVYIEHERGDYYSLDAATGEHLLVNTEETGRIRGAQLRDGAVHVTAVLRDGGIVVRSHDPQTGELLRESRPQVPEIDYDQFKVTVLGDSTYISDGPMTHAFDAPAGNLLWSFDAGVNTRGSPAASDGVVYMRSAFAAHALDEATGDEIWKFDGPYGDWTEHPTYIVDGVWVVLLRYGALHGLNAATGQSLWSYPDGYAVFVSGAANGTVFVVTGEGEYRALDAATGDQIWSRGVGSDFEVQEVTVADGVLYSTYSTSRIAWLQVLNARTGESIWNSYGVNRPLGADPYLADPYLAMDGMLYLASQGTIFALPAPQRR